MNEQIAWLVILTILMLAQALLLALKMLNNRKNKKENNPGKYGERIAKLETKVENIEDDIREIKRELSRKK